MRYKRLIFVFLVLLGFVSIVLISKIIEYSQLKQEHTLSSSPSTNKSESTAETIQDLSSSVYSCVSDGGKCDIVQNVYACNAGGSACTGSSQCCSGICSSCSIIGVGEVCNGTGSCSNTGCSPSLREATGEAPTGSVAAGSRVFTFSFAQGIPRGGSFYLDDLSNGWGGNIVNGSCSGVSNNPGDICTGLPATSATSLSAGPYNLVAGRSYRWWVRLKDSCGNMGPFSYNNISVAAATAPLGCPTGLAYTCGAGGTSVTIRWNALSGAATYKVNMNRAPQNDWAGPGDYVINPITGTSKSTATTPGYTYYWDVQGVRSGEPAPYSGCRTFSTLICQAATPTPRPTATPRPRPTPTPNCGSATITSVTASAGSNSITQRWTAPTNCGTFHVAMAPGNNFQYDPGTNIAATTQTFTWTNGTTYNGYTFRCDGVTQYRFYTSYWSGPGVASWRGPAGPITCGVAPTPRPRATPTPRPAPTATPRPRPTATPRPRPTATPRPRAVPTATPRPRPTATPRPRATATPRPRATATPVPRVRATATPRPRATATPRPRATATPRPRAVPTPTVRVRATATPRPRATATPRPRATATPVPRVRATATPRPRATATPRPRATATPRPRVRPTNTPAPRATATPRPRPTPTTGAGTPTPIPTFTISGIVYEDIDGDGTQDAGENPYTPSLSIQLTGGTTQTTSTSGGSYSFSNLTARGYSIQLLGIPANYTATTANPRSVTIVSSNLTVNFGIAPTYTVVGNVFVDSNGNRIRDNGEVNYQGRPTITSSNGSVSTTNTGSFTISNVIAGNRTVRYTSLPGGFQMVYPLNGPPPAFSPRVGSGCTVDNTTGASCDGNGNIQELNFAISNTAPWVQTIGLNMRFDSGYDNAIPATPACSGAFGSINGSSTTPGILFTGDSSARFGSGQASSNRWIVGGTTYPEVYRIPRGQLSSAYPAVLSSLRRAGTTVTNIQTVNGCNNLANCTLPNNLQTIGSVFQANGNLTLNSYSFPPNSNFMILVNGTLTIRGPIQVPVGSTALFTAAQDIRIDQSVGFAPSCDPGNTAVQGLYSADNDFIIQGINNCATGSDLMLRIDGSVIVNAGATGGIFQNNRDLCGDNQSYPSVTFAERPDFILNMPNVIRSKRLLYQEVAP